MSSISASRDVRVDFLRGIALLVIFVDHIDGNILASVTYRLSGFSDASQWFVLLSGYVVGMAYMRAIDRDGIWRTQAKACYRAGQLYVAHLVTLAVAVIVFHHLLAAAPPLSVGGVDYEYLRAAGWSGVWEVMTLRHLPPLFDILPAYMIFIVAAPAFLWAFRRFGWRAPLAASAVLYTIPLLFRDANLPNLPSGHWYLNPLSWQFLFFIGVSAGAGGRLRDEAAMRSRRLFRIAGAVFAAGFVLKAAVVQIFHDQSVVPWVGKTALEPVLLLHFLALVYLVLWALPRGAGVLSRPWAQALSLCGRRPLPIFCAGLLLSVAATALLARHPGLEMQLALSAAGCTLLLAMSGFIERAGPARLPRRTATVPVSLAEIVPVGAAAPMLRRAA